jgi:two-component system alkaline phosphatase synthesis response regulator PhoP
MNGRTIAVVDDDDEMRELMALVLGKAGFKVHGYATPGRFFDALVKSKPDLCLIDVQLPGMDGREMVRVLRSNPETKTLPIIMMTSVAVSPADVVKGVDNGADEYFSKPLDLELLVVRAQNLLSRAARKEPIPQNSIVWGELEVTPDEHLVAVKGKNIVLTNLEFKLLLAFLTQPNRVLPRSWLLQNVWDATSSVSTRTVDKHVETLRRKVAPLTANLETVVGVGYLFRP